MGIFKSEKPRAFNHQYIYVDERKERLAKMEENAKRDLGMLPPSEESYRDRLKGAFVNDNSHLSRRKENGQRLSSGAIVVALFICVFLLFYLLKKIWQL